VPARLHFPDPPQSRRGLRHGAGSSRTSGLVTARSGHRRPAKRLVLDEAFPSRHEDAMETPEQGRPLPETAPPPAQPPHSEALEAELAALEAMLPPRPAVPAPDADSEND
jgi:hypothetical protein